MDTISNTTCTKCQLCGEWTNYADDPHHKAREAHIAELEAELDALRRALGGLGVIGDGYCFCSENRGPHKEQHQPECRLARAALEGK